MEKKIVTPVTIRKATHADLDTVAEFIKTFVDAGDLLPRTFQELSELVDTLFIAEMDGQLVGTAALEIYNKKLAEIRSLAVSPLARGSGVGKKLVNACVELGKERGVFEIMAITHEEAFFKACGFDFTLPTLRKAFFIQTRDEL